MADEPETIDLTQLGSTYAKALTDDLKALVGAELKLKGPTIELIDRALAAGDDDPVAHALCRAKDGSDKSLHFVMPRPEAVTLASLLMGQSADRIEELRKKAIDAETIDAFGEVLNFACAALNRIFTDEYKLPGLALEGCEESEDPLTDGAWLENGDYRRVRFRVVIPDYPEGIFDLLFPEDVATGWFGEAPADARRVSKSGGADAGDGGQEAREPKAVVFIDACEDQRDAAEDLEEELGHPVWGLDPDDVDPDDLDELAEADAFVISWNLKVRPGLAILEALRSDERTCRIPILMVSDAPTEVMVRAALHGGANGFMIKPFEAAVLRDRLEPMIEARFADE